MTTMDPRERRGPMTIGPRRILNHTPFGSLLRRTARGLLPRFLGKHDHGFQDGGCAMMAHALVQWSEGRLTPARYVLARCPERVQHVVARDEALVLDSDGVMTTQDGIDKLCLHEMTPGCILLEGYDPTSSPDIPDDAESVRWIASALRDRLPSPQDRPWRGQSGR